MPNQLPLDQTLTIKVIVKSPEEKIILANVGSEVPNEESSHSFLSTASDDASEKALADQLIADIKVFADLSEVGDEAVVVRTLGELNKAYGIDIEALEELSHEDLDGDMERGESEEHADKVLGEPQEVSVDTLDLDNFSDPTLSIIEDDDDEVQVLNPDMKEGYNPLDWSYEIEEEIMTNEELTIEEDKIDIPNEEETVELEEANSEGQIANFISRIIDTVNKGGLIDRNKLVGLGRTSGITIDGALIALARIVTGAKAGMCGIYKKDGDYFIGPAVLSVKGLVQGSAGQGASSMTSGISPEQATNLVQNSQKIDLDAEGKQAVSVLASALQ